MRKIEKRYKSLAGSKEALKKEKKGKMEKEQRKKYSICIFLILIWIFANGFYYNFTEQYILILPFISGLMMLIPGYIIAKMSTERQEDNYYNKYYSLDCFCDEAMDLLEEAVDNEEELLTILNSKNEEIKRIKSEERLAKENAHLRKENKRLNNEADNIKNEANNYKIKVETIYKTKNLNYSSSSISSDVTAYVDAVVEKGWGFMFYPYYFVHDENYRNIINNNAKIWKDEIKKDINGNNLNYLIELQEKAGLMPYKKVIQQTGKKNNSTDLREEIERLREKKHPKQHDDELEH